MTQEQITQNNKLIAEFMGWKKHGKRFLTPYSEPINTPVESLDDYDDILPPSLMRFHSSLDWLMPVLNKIVELGYDYTIKPNQTCIWDSKGDILIDSDEGEDHTYWAVCRFFEWYNEQK